MTTRPEYFKRLLTFARRHGRSLEDAEDLVQEAMLRLHVYRRDAVVGNEEAFLRHALRNLSIDQHRRERHDLYQDVPLEDVAREGRLISQAPTPEEQFEARQRITKACELLDAVSRKTRNIYIAHRAGYSYEEIAAHMGLAKVTIRRHIARASAILEQHRVNAVNDPTGYGSGKSDFRRWRVEDSPRVAVWESGVYTGLIGGVPPDLMYSHFAGNTVHSAFFVN